MIIGVLRIGSNGVPACHGRNGRLARALHDLDATLKGECRNRWYGCVGVPSAILAGLKSILKKVSSHPLTEGEKIDD